MTPNELARELERIYGGELKSVVLYGSGAGGNHSKRFSDYNVFCVLADPTPAALARANGVVRRWVRAGNPPPLFFGPKHIERSLDVFPMEFLDMIAMHRVLIGSDPLDGARVEPKNLRHECEAELKGKLLRLRAAFAADCHKPKRVARLMVESFPSFLAALRALLRLGNLPAGGEAAEVVERAAGAAGFNPEAFLEVAAIRSGEAILPRGDEAISLFERYLTEIEAVTNHVDGRAQ